MQNTTSFAIPKTSGNLKPGERFLRLEQVNEKIGTRGKTIYDWIREGRFPKSIALYGGRVAWLESEVENWMSSRVALRDGEQ